MEDLVKFALNLCKGAKYAEVRLEESESTGFSLKNGIPEVSGFDKGAGIGIRVLVNGAMGFSSTNILQKENIRNAVNLAIKSAKLSSPTQKEKTHLTKEKSNIKTIITNPKKDPFDLSTEQKFKLLKDIDEVAKKQFVVNRVLSFSHSRRNKIYMNTEGSKIIQNFPRIDFFWFLTVMHEQKTKQKWLGYDAVQGLEALKEWKLENEIEHHSSALYTNLRKGKKTPEGIFDVVCGPEVVGIACHESVGHPTEADRILGREAAQAGESFVTKEMLGTVIGSNIVNVSEDPLIKGTAGYYLYDDEGVKAKKRRLIHRGKYCEFLQNRETAVKYGVQSNASARASDYNREPLIRMANTFLEKGNSSREEILRETKKGIYIKSFMEWNIDDKRYNQKYVGAEAYYVENGEIKFPLVNPALEVTTPKFWSSVSLIGKDLQLFAGNCGKGEPMQGAPVTMGGPTIQLKNIRFR